MLLHICIYYRCGRLGAAAFHRLSDRALLFAGLGKVRDPHSVFRRDQVEEDYLRKSLRRDQQHVVISASSKRFMIELIEEVAVLESFFPGLRRLCALFPCYSCRINRRRECDELSELCKLKGTNESRTYHQLFEEGVAALQCAESADASERSYLAKAMSVGGDHLNCVSLCQRYESIFCKAYKLVEELNAVAPYKLKGMIDMEFDKNGLLLQTYCRGYACPTPRFYLEVRLYVCCRLFHVVRK